MSPLQFQHFYLVRRPTALQGLGDFKSSLDKTLGFTKEKGIRSETLGINNDKEIPTTIHKMIAKGKQGETLCSLDRGWDVVNVKAKVENAQRCITEFEPARSLKVHSVVYKYVLNPKCSKQHQKPLQKSKGKG